MTASLSSDDQLKPGLFWIISYPKWIDFLSQKHDQQMLALCRVSFSLSLMNLAFYHLPVSTLFKSSLVTRVSQLMNLFRDGKKMVPTLWRVPPMREVKYDGSAIIPPIPLELSSNRGPFLCSLPPSQRDYRPSRTHVGFIGVIPPASRPIKRMPRNTPRPETKQKQCKYLDDINKMYN